jgi:hypothetical protein
MSEREVRGVSWTVSPRPTDPTDHLGSRRELATRATREAHVYSAPSAERETRLSAPQACGARWTEERGTSDEGSARPERAEAARETQ